MYLVEDKNIIKNLILFFITATLVIINYQFALNLCDITNIPFNLTISIFSIGFGYELVLVITSIEIIFFHYFTILLEK